jgi:hypothetical protein
MLFTDKEDIQLQYHPQLNELMNPARKAIVFKTVMQKKTYWQSSFVQSNEREILSQ